MATTQYSVRLTKSFPYRGDPIHQFSNRYYFDGSAPADTTAWHDLFDAIVLEEKALHLTDVTITGAFGYAPGSEVAVASQTYTTAGTLTVTGAKYVPGDCAVVLRQATTKRSTKNHPVYLFSYFHHVAVSGTSGEEDKVLAAQKTAVENFGNAWVSGITVGARTYKRCTPDGHLATGAHCLIWIGHRDFPN